MTYYFGISNVDYYSVSQVGPGSDDDLIESRNGKIVGDVKMVKFVKVLGEDYYQEISKGLLSIARFQHLFVGMELGDNMHVNAR